MYLLLNTSFDQHPAISKGAFGNSAVAQKIPPVTCSGMSRPRRQLGSSHAA